MKKNKTKDKEDKELTRNRNKNTPTAKGIRFKTLKVRGAEVGLIHECVARPEEDTEE